MNPMSNTEFNNHKLTDYSTNFDRSLPLNPDEHKEMLMMNRTTLNDLHYDLPQPSNFERPGPPRLLTSDCKEMATLITKTFVE